MVLTRGELGDVLTDSLAMFEADLVTGLITWASYPMEVMFGYTMHGALEGLFVEELMPPDAREQHAKVDRPAFAANPRCMAVKDARCMRKDRTEFRAEVALMPKAVAGRRVVIGLVREEEPCGPTRLP